MSTPAGVTPKCPVCSRPSTSDNDLCKECLETYSHLDDDSLEKLVEMQKDYEEHKKELVEQRHLQQINSDIAAIQYKIKQKQQPKPKQPKPESPSQDQLAEQMTPLDPFPPYALYNLVPFADIEQKLATVRSKPQYTWFQQVVKDYIKASPSVKEPRLPNPSSLKVLKEEEKKEANELFKKLEPSLMEAWKQANQALARIPATCEPLLIDLCKAGHLDAVYLLAVQKGSNYNESIALLQHAALAGHLPSYLRMLLRFSESFKEFEEHPKAYDFQDRFVREIRDIVPALTEWAKAGSAIAHMQLGEYYFALHPQYRLESEQEHKTKALYHYTQAARGGSFPSMCMLHSMYSDNKQYAEAEYWAQQAAERGDANAEHKLVELKKKNKKK